MDHWIARAAYVRSLCVHCNIKMAFPDLFARICLEERDLRSSTCCIRVRISIHVNVLKSSRKQSAVESSKLDGGGRWSSNQSCHQYNPNSHAMVSSSVLMMRERRQCNDCGGRKRARWMFERYPRYVDAKPNVATQSTLAPSPISNFRSYQQNSHHSSHG